MNAESILKSYTGRDGSQVIADTERHAGSWHRVHAISNTVILELVDAGMSGSLSGVTIPAGQDILGNFTTIKLTSGTIIAYC